MIGVAFLLVTSLLIPKPNPRHQRRRFQATKVLYAMLFLTLGLVLSQHFGLNHSNDLIANAQVPDLELLTLFLAPLSFFVLVVSLLLTRKYAA